jgi:hypothetical protein
MIPKKLSGDREKSDLDMIISAILQLAYCHRLAMGRKLDNSKPKVV